MTSGINEANRRDCTCWDPIFGGPNACMLHETPILEPGHLHNWEDGTPASSAVECHECGLDRKALRARRMKR